MESSLAWSSIVTYSSVFILKGEAIVVHGVNGHAQTIEDVVEYDDAPFLLLVLVEAILGVYESHLLEDSRFPTLSGACD
jgi:succinate dehydrogenase hydrophobic anchor subunit